MAASDDATQSARALLHDGLDNGVVQLESGGAQGLRHGRNPRLLLADNVGGTHSDLIREDQPTGRVAKCLKSIVVVKASLHGGELVARLSHAA